MCLTPLDQRRTTVCFFAVITACILHIFHSNQSFKKKVLLAKFSRRKKTDHLGLSSFTSKLLQSFFPLHTKNPTFFCFLFLYGVFFCFICMVYQTLTTESWVFRLFCVVFRAGSLDLWVCAYVLAQLSYAYLPPCHSAHSSAPVHMELCVWESELCRGWYIFRQLMHYGEWRWARLNVNCWYVEGSGPVLPRPYVLA